MTAFKKFPAPGSQSTGSGFVNCRGKNWLLHIWKSENRISCNAQIAEAITDIRSKRDCGSHGAASMTIEIVGRLCQAPWRFTETPYNLYNPNTSCIE